MSTHHGATRTRVTFRPRPDGRLDPAGEAGWYLQRERELRGIPLEKAGQDTGIHPHHLEAIENGDLERLPQRAEALRMIGAYARYLGFDPKPLEQHYARLLPREESRRFASARIIPFPLIERLRGFPSGAGTIVASVLAVVVLFGGIVWTFLPSGEEPGEGWTEITADAGDTGAAKDTAADPRTVASISALAQKAAESADDTTATAAGDGIGALIARTMPDVVAGEGKKTATASPAAAASDAATKTASRDAAPAGKGEAAAANGPRLMLRAVRDVWLQVEDAEGRALFSGDLKAGSSFTLPAGIAPERVIVTSNDGGALRLVRGDRTGAPLMADGQAIVGRSLAELMKKKGG